MRNALYCAIVMLMLCTSASASPKTRTEYGLTKDGFARVRIINETNENLRCYVAIDGYKIPFKLISNAKSKWYTATDKRYNYSHFSTWCDFARNYAVTNQPESQP